MFFFKRITLSTVYFLSCLVDLCSFSSDIADGRPWCNFENPYRDTFCRWKMLDSDQFGANLVSTAQWIVINGPSPYPDTGIDYDHTTANASGKYMYLKVDRNITSRWTFAARLYSVELTATGTGHACFHMWYYMKGSDIDSLNLLYLTPENTYTRLWERKAHTGGRWFSMAYIIKSPVARFRLIIEGVSKGRLIRDYINDQRSSLKSLIAVDDISYTFNDCESCAWGYYGLSCLDLCGHCLGNVTCAKDGLCEACQPGYTHPKCFICLKGYYAPGAGCLKCGRCDNDAQCHRFSGDCAACAPGFRFPKCTECSEHHYGRDCQPCGRCYKSRPCEKKTGICFRDYNGVRCQIGYSGTHCRDRCSPGTYGSNCLQKCGHCANNLTCTSDVGQCQNCSTGYVMPLCKDTCPAGTYGPGCSKKCGACVFDWKCHYATGVCFSCKPGKIPNLCQEDCHDGYYGDHCLLRCGLCALQSACNKVTGHCIRGCKPGYRPPLCQTECATGFYGDCNSTCGHCAQGAPCDPATGHCRLCSPGFEPPFCTECRLPGGCQDVAEATTKETKSRLVSPTSFALYLGLSALLAGLLFLVVFFVLHMRRRSGGKDEDVDDEDLPPVKIHLNLPDLPAQPVSDVTTAVSEEPTSPFIQRPVTSIASDVDSAPELESSTLISETTDTVEPSSFVTSEQ